MRFTVKVVIGSALVGALAIVAAAVLTLAFRRYERAHHLVFLFEQARGAEQGLQSSLLLELQAVELHLVHPDARTLAQVHEAARKSASLMDAALGMDREFVGTLGEPGFTDERLRYSASLQGALKRFEERFEEIGRLLVGVKGADRLRAQQLAEDLKRDILAQVGEMDRVWAQNVGEVLARIERERRRATVTLGALLATSLAVGVGLAVSVVVSLRRVIRRLSAGMRRVAAGDYDNPVPRGDDPEINELVDRFNAMAEDLKNLEEARRDFISMLSHDMKSPLAVIRMHADALEERGVVDRPELHAIARSAERLLRLVENVLDFTRVGDAPVAVQAVPVDLEALVERVRSDGSVLAKPYRIEVRADVEAGLPPVLADEAQLERALHNLVSNGVKYNRPEGTVVLRARRREHGVRVEVEDSGIGISAADRERLFAKYFRSERTRHIRGTGLGLAVTREIIRAHGGELEFESREGEGTVLGFTLPAACASAIRAPSGTPPVAAGLPC